MEAKDTVIGKVQRDNIFYRGIGTLEGVCKIQAEISFKAGYDEAIGCTKESLSSIKGKAYYAGKEAGRREVVEWGDELCHNTEHHSWWDSMPRSKCPDCWQAQLKEWGIK